MPSQVKFCFFFLCVTALYPCHLRWSSVFFSFVSQPYIHAISDEVLFISFVSQPYFHAISGEVLFFSFVSQPYIHAISGEVLFISFVSQPYIHAILGEVLFFSFVCLFVELLISPLYFLRVNWNFIEWTCLIVSGGNWCKYLPRSYWHSREGWIQDEKGSSMGHNECYVWRNRWTNKILSRPGLYPSSVRPLNSDGRQNCPSGSQWIGEYLEARRSRCKNSWRH